MILLFFRPYIVSEYVIPNLEWVEQLTLRPENGPFTYEALPDKRNRPKKRTED